MRTAFILAAITFGSPARALEPADIIVLVNQNVPASRQVANHYVAKRGVPAANIVELDLPTGEDITRDDYESKLLGPLRIVLADRKASVKCVLAVYGVPLRVGAKTASADDKALAAKLKTALEMPEHDAKQKAELQGRLILAEQRESLASVDSELMLLWWPPYPLARWVVNPLHWQLPEEKRKKLPPGLMTCRLDGPTPALAMRLVDDAIAVEKAGLKGHVYIDARGIAFDPSSPGENGGYGYGGYDESMREAAALLTTANLPVTLDDKPALFADGSCADAALYCGWYSPNAFKPCCTFARGAVAWHLASFEALSLRDDKSQGWCPNLLKAGAAATLGPVAEPYTIGFPKPAEFFGFLTTGDYTLAEVYARTITFASWMTVLVGDPLYTPYRKTPKLKLADVLASPKGGRYLFK